MIGGEKILALIPARGGSKGIKKKNITRLCGKPLIAHTILAAEKSAYVDQVLVTTDSEEIRQVGREYGAYAPFLRPPELSGDTAETIGAVLHAVKWLQDSGEDYDILLLLQPTQPLRRSEDIDRALETFLANGGEEGLVSVRTVREHPILMRTIENGRLRNLLPLGSTVRRQDMPGYVLVDGSIYINRIDRLNENTSFNDNPIPFLMSGENSIDIDGPDDLELAEWYMEKRREREG